MAGEGVNVVGYVHERSGLGSIVRLLLEALRVAEVPVAVFAVGEGPWTTKLRRPELPFDTTIFCVNPDVLPALVQRFGRAFFRDRRTIGFWWWEVERFPPLLAAAAYLVDELWVGSSYVARAVGGAVASAVHVFPVPVPRLERVAIDRADLGIPRDAFVFLFAFSFRSNFDRKNPLGLVDAFSRAFAPGEGPVLVLKTSHGRWH